MPDLDSLLAARVGGEPVPTAPASAPAPGSFEALLAARAGGAKPGAASAPTGLASFGAQVARQLGLTARAAVTGVTGLPAVLGDALNASVNLGIRGVNSAAETNISQLQPVSSTIQQGMDAAGFPTPQNATEHIVQEAANAMASVSPTIVAGRLLARSAKPAAIAIGRGLAAVPGMQFAVGAGSGAGMSGAHEMGFGPAAEIAGAVLGGGAGVLAGSGATASVRSFANAAAKRNAPILSASEAATKAHVGVDKVVSDLGPTGSAAFAPGETDAIKLQIAPTIALKPHADVAAVVRANDFRNLGIQQTLGQVTREPMQFAREQNIRSVVGVGDPLTARFNQQHTQLQNALFTLGGQAQQKYQAGSQLREALQGIDENMNASVKAAYAAAEASSGKRLEVPLAGLAQDYAEVLHNFGDKVPSGVRGNFEALGLQGGTQRKIFSVDHADKLLKVINANASNDPATNAALKQLRTSVKNAVLAADDGGGVFKPASDLAKQRFDALRDIPALRGAVEENIAPDDFVKTFIMNGKTEDVQALGQMLSAESPQVMGEMRNQMGARFAQAAFGENLAGDGGFKAAAYVKALREMGDAKLSAFYSPDEVAQLHTIGRVASYVNSLPSASPVNFSNTAGAVRSFFGKGLNIMPGMTGLRDLMAYTKNRAFVNKALAAEISNTAVPAGPASAQQSGLGAALLSDPLVVPPARNR